MVFDFYPTGGGEMLLALSLADFANDDGGSIFPSVATLARKTRQSPRSVQYQLRRMERGGFLIRLGKKPNTGTTQYRINLGFFEEGRKNCAPHSKECKQQHRGAQSTAPGGAIAIAPESSYPSYPSSTGQHQSELDPLAMAAGQKIIDGIRAKRGIHA